MINIDLHKISLPRGVYFVIILAGVFLAPFQFIFQFAPTIFEKTDTIKLILLCLSFGVPLVGVSTVVVMAYFDEDFGMAMKDDDSSYFLLSLGSGVVIGALMIPCSGTIFYQGVHTSTGLTVAMFTWGLLQIMVFLMAYSSKRKYRKK